MILTTGKQSRNSTQASCEEVSADLSGSPPRGHVAAKDRAGGGRFRDYAALFVDYGAFDISDRAPSLQNGALSPEPSLPDRPEEIPLQFDGRERFVGRQSACERHAHSSIRDVAKKDRKSTRLNSSHT